MRLSRLLPALLVGGLLPACAPRPSGSGAPSASGAAVSVLVLDGRTDRALPGATVTATRGAGSFTVAAGQDGVAVAQGLEAGDWLFTASAPGYQPMAGTVAVDPAKTGKYTLAIKLDPEQAAAPAPEKK
jgi:hypothetical protein